MSCFSHWSIKIVPPESTLLKNLRNSFMYHFLRPFSSYFLSLSPHFRYCNFWIDISARNVLSCNHSLPFILPFLLDSKDILCKQYGGLEIRTCTFEIFIPCSTDSCYWNLLRRVSSFDFVGWLTLHTML